MYHLGTKSKSNLVGVHPILSFAVYEAIKITKQDFTVFDGLRPKDKQMALVASGASRTLDSYHLYGLAVDLVAWVDGAPSWEEKYYKDISDAMKEIIKKYELPIEWGFDLWGWDMPHYQLTGFKSEYDARKYIKNGIM